MNIAVMRKNKDVDKIIHTSLHLEIYPGSQVLRNVARPIEVFGNEIQLLSSLMLDFMRDNHGIGLAAPQIGLSRRIIVAELNNQNYCLVNPVQILVPEREMMEECCLSLPGKTYKIKRSKCVEIHGQDPTGKPISLIAVGLLARVFQHEIDHLNGVMICDYESRM